MNKLKVIFCTVIIFVITVIIYFNFFPPVPDFTLDRLYLKELEDSNIRLKWFFYSAAYTETPDYITMELNNTIDTICVASNVADLRFENNRIVIGFYGMPQRYGDPLTIPCKVKGYKIIVDTAYTTNSLTAPREYYKKDK
jgi:hypothetical protein